MAIAIIFPRSATTVFLVPVFLAFGFSLASQRQRAAQTTISPLLSAVVLFSLWALLSATWSLAPMASLSKPLFLLGGSIGVGLIASMSGQIDRARLESISVGIIIGLAIGGTLLCIETLTNQAISRTLISNIAWLRQGYEKHITIENDVVVMVSEANINRRSTLVTLLLLPTALLVWVCFRSRRWRFAGLIGVGVVTAILLAATSHQSSQAAIVAGGAAFAMALASPKVARWLVGAAWCVSCLLTVPLVVALHGTEIHKKPEALANSARHRIVIWNATVEEIKKAPLLGIGADATATRTARLESQIKRQAEAPRDGQYVVTTARHAHNAFLQVWYELGFVGATLFALIGIAAIAVIGRLPVQVQPVLLGQFAASAGMLAFSFGLWQLWLQGALGLGLLALLVGLALPDHSKANATLGS